MGRPAQVVNFEIVRMAQSEKEPGASIPEGVD
jgi:hypothetical protein